MSALANYIWTEAEYLSFERGVETKHEFLDGAVVAMVGASRNHDRIVTNTLASLHSQLRGSTCEAFSSDMRVRVPAARLYTYPDLKAVCGEAQFTDDTPDTLLNPTLIVEVLSPSTERYDRGKKFKHYRLLESLRQYVLISQDSPHIEVYTLTDQQWVLSEADGLDASIELTSIGCMLALSDVYERVELDNMPPSQGE